MNSKFTENTEPHEKMICKDSDSEDDDCVDHEPVQPKILSLSEAIGMMDYFAERRLQDGSLVLSLNKVRCLMQNLRIRESQAETYQQKKHQQLMPRSLS